MVIKVSFPTQSDTGNPELPTTILTRYFEINTATDKSVIVGKLWAMGFHFDPKTLSIATHYQDAAIMRSNGIIVSRIYPNTQ